MRRFLVAVIAATILSLNAVGAAAAGGPQPGKLSDHGWTCFFVPNLGVHCAPPGRGFAPPIQQPTPLLYWLTTTDPASTSGDFTGTELLLPHSQYNGQPCPQEGRDAWVDIGIAMACHHN